MDDRAEAAETSSPVTAGDPDGPSGAVTLAFVGDMHFQLQLAALLDHPRGALGPIARTLGDADVAMANLESAVTERGTLEAKELEVPGRRYYFRTSPAALDVLDGPGSTSSRWRTTTVRTTDRSAWPTRCGDPQRPGARDRHRRDRRAALAPYRVKVRGTELAFLAADASPREGSSSVWSAGPTHPGIAAARADRPRALLAAVRAANRRDDVVVVYLHWGAEGRACPDPPAADHSRGPWPGRGGRRGRHPRPRARGPGGSATPT